MASLSLVLIEHAGAYSKLLETIETPLRIHLQLFVPAVLSIKNQCSMCASRAFWGIKCTTVQHRLVFCMCACIYALSG